MHGVYLLDNIRETYAERRFYDVIFVSLLISISAFIVMSVIISQLNYSAFSMQADYLALVPVLFLATLILAVTFKYRFRIPKNKKLLLSVEVIVSLILMYVVL